MDGLEKCEALGPLIMDESFLGLYTKIQYIRQAEVEYILPDPYWSRYLVGRVKPGDGEF